MTWPAGWTVDVQVKRGGGRDARGNPKPETTLVAASVLVGWRSTADPVDRSEVTSDQAVLYDPLPGSGIVWRADDRVVIPEGHSGPQGTWQVDGQPKSWPLGWEVPLRHG